MTPSDEMWTVGRLLSWTSDFLERHGSDNPRLDAEVLLAAARGCRRIDLYIAFNEVPDDRALATFRDWVRRRASGTPVAYLVGHREFYALEFAVTPDVLIPRPETELLVVAMLDFAKELAENRKGEGNPPPPGEIALRIADVGTGSGILAVCAAKYLPDAKIIAIDVSAAALAVARNNAERHSVAERIDFLESNLFAAAPREQLFDMIVSNPPYVSTAEMAELPADVREHEPRLALEAGETGTAVIQPLIQQAAERLRPGGLLAIEVSPMIAANVERLIESSNLWALGPTLRDLAGHSRVVEARRK